MGEVREALRKDGDLTTFADLVTAAGLQEIGSYADGIGPCKNLVITRDQAGNLFEPSGVVTDAHAADLVVHPFTFRVENQFLPLELRNSADGNAPAISSANCTRSCGPGSTASSPTTRRSG